MSIRELELQIHEMFQELNEKAKEIIATSRTAKKAIERISDVISVTVAAECEGYVVDMYTMLVAKIKEDEFFKNPKNLNNFYRLNLREKLDEKYQFEIKSLQGITYEEINQFYMTAGVMAGTVTVGGILKFALAETINIPIVLILAGAVLAGLVVYTETPKKNKKAFLLAVSKYLEAMEQEILEWIKEIENYFNSEVQTLYKK